MIKTKKALLTLSLWSAMAVSAFAQGTAFTYQGQLSSGTSPANGNYDVQFTLFSASSGGSAVAGPVVKSGIGVTNGLFTTTVDFGAAFTGTSNWLELAVRTNGAPSFSPPLTPRQPLTPTPYAVYAESANATNLVGTLSGSGSGLTNLNATKLTGTLADANLPADVALLGANQTFTGNNNFNSSVGIGTTSPMGTLELRDAGGRNLVMSGPGGAEFSFYDSTANAFGWDISGTLNAFAISDSGIGYPLTILRPSGNVGIGTTTPTSTLAVEGNIFLGTERNDQVFNQIGDTLYLGAEQKYLGNTLLSPIGGSTDWINLMANPISAGIMFGTSGSSTTDPHSNITALVVIKPNGNVGIGVTNPASVLAVSGTANPAISLTLSNGATGELDFGIASFTAAFSASSVTGDAVIRQSGNGRLLLQTGTTDAAAIVIATNNNVGIGTTAPNNDSLLQVKGMMRMGSETGTSEAPAKPLMIRRINSTAKATGQVVARSLSAGGTPLTLERDGTAGGLVFNISGTLNSGAQVSGYGINSSGALVSLQMPFYGGSSYPPTQIFTDAQKIAYIRLTFGDAANPSDVTTVEAIRFVDNSGNDLTSWVGTVTSTVNQ